MSITLKVQNIGWLKFELHTQECPLACANFLALAASGYYDGTCFHRNIKGFIVQGGDPTNTGKGGESIYGKPFKDEIKDTLRHEKRGTLSMANQGADKNTSQFFVTYGKHQTLDGKFTVFGHLVDGFETLDLMEQEPVDKSHKPLNELVVEGVEIHANPLAYLPLAEL